MNTMLALLNTLLVFLKLAKPQPGPDVPKLKPPTVH
jgi:hypothetical protein